MNQDEATPPTQHAPRFMTETQIRQHFGLTERALVRCRLLPDFPKKNALTNRTDGKLVDRFFDRLSGIEPSSAGDTSVAAMENWT